MTISKRVARVVSFLVILVTLASLARYSSPSINLSLVLLAVAATLLSWLCNALRFRMLVTVLEARFSLRECLLLFLSADAASKLTPGDSGALALYTVFLRSRGVGAATITGVIGLGIGLDAACLLALVGIAALPLQDYAHYIFAMGLIILVLLLRSGLRRRHGARSEPAGKLQAFLYDTMVYFSLFRAWKIAGIAMLTMGYWAFRFSTLWLCLLATQAPVPLPDAVAAQFLANAAGAASLLPIGGGTIEATAVWLLQQHADVVQILPAVLLWRALSVYLLLIIGPVAGYLLVRQPATD